jgi:lipopolysaccharide/colanic/teichoic acid biosynthesis glycosyltransferase
MKRTMDILGSLACLAMFSPLLIVISAMIKMSSSGPIIFRQERVGLYGKKFTFLKFRSMYVNNDSTVHKEYVKKLITGKNGNGTQGNGVYKITNDMRVTLIGKFLRKSSLDELPQLINVLKGDMSLVGPRPPIPYELEKYEMWHRRRVLEVKPGISGLWQIKGRSRTTFDEMVRLDLQYTKEQSLWLDIKILLQTPWAVLTARGAY